MKNLLKWLVGICVVLQVAWFGAWYHFHAHPPGPDTQTDEVLQSYLSADRDTWQQTERVIKTMGLGPGDRVADIGAGSGYFTWHFSEVVGARGRVLAVDVDPNAISFMRRRMDREPPAFPNIDLVLSKYDSVVLDADSIDHAFMCEAHFFVETTPDLITRCMASIFRAVREGGKVSVIEVKSDPRRGDVTHDRLVRPFVRAGFVVDSRHEYLGREHFVIFKKPARGASPSSSAGPAAAAIPQVSPQKLR